MRMFIVRYYSSLKLECFVFNCYMNAKYVQTSSENLKMLREIIHIVNVIGIPQIPLLY